MAGTSIRYCYYTKGRVRIETALAKHKGLKNTMTKSFCSVVVMLNARYLVTCSYNLI